MLNVSNDQVLISLCSIAETEFQYTLPREVVCHDNHFKIAVTPVNGAGHGISESINLLCKAVSHV